jgi:hypothetical protein
MSDKARIEKTQGNNESNGDQPLSSSCLPDTTVEPKSQLLTFEKIECLSEEAFTALPESEKKRFFRWMTLENTPREFYADPKEYGSFCDYVNEDPQ